MTTTERQLTPVAFTSVQFNDAFWTPRLEANRSVTIVISSR
jgi:hypothetical protein